MVKNEKGKKKNPKTQPSNMCPLPQKKWKTICPYFDGITLYQSIFHQLVIKRMTKYKNKQINLKSYVVIIIKG